jgi:hypothetical protein
MPAFSHHLSGHRLSAMRAAIVLGMSAVPEIMVGPAGSFAWRVFHERHPRLLSQIRAAHPYGPAQLDALDALLRESTEGVLTPLPGDAPGKAGWDRWGAGYYGRPWIELPFLWAESYFYRRLLHAVHWYPPGAWAGVDPFGFLKSAELKPSTVDDDADLRTLLYAAMWGNQADLGFLIGGGGVAGQNTEHLLADDSEVVLNSGTWQRICLVTDNSGPELLADLVLLDRLLATGRAGAVEVHVKPYPYYVSDVTTADLVAALRLLPPEPAARLRQAGHDGRLTLATHGFHAAPFDFRHLPDDLADRFAAADLVVLKGDLNYRRLVGDRRWPATTPFPEVAGYFPAPVLALRTLKSEVCVGLDPATVARLDATEPDWRISGRYAVVQARLR